MEGHLQRPAFQCPEHGAVCRSFGKPAIAAVFRRPELAIERSESDPARAAYRFLARLRRRRTTCISPFGGPDDLRLMGRGDGVALGTGTLGVPSRDTTGPRYPIRQTNFPPAGIDTNCCSTRTRNRVKE